MKSQTLVAYILSLVVVLGWAVPSQAAYEFYMSVKGAKQGQFKAENTKVPGGLTCLGLQFTGQSPRDAATGQPSGRRQYSPLTVTRQFGAASPQIFQAFATNEVLPEVILSFPQLNPDGTSTIVTTIKLINATLSRVDYRVETAAPEKALQHLLEDVSFSFQKIEITSAEGGTMAMDDAGGAGALSVPNFTIPGGRVQ